MTEAALQAELETPRDRSGTFEPQRVGKHRRHLTDELERKILSLFAQDMSYQAMREHVQEMYGMRLSNGTLSAITDKLLPELESWRERQLDAIYPFVWLDAVHYKGQGNQSLDGEIPAVVGGDYPFTTANLSNYAWQSHCGGLFQTPVPA